MLNGLDVFSGIGGITYSLKGIVKPVGYIEIDEYCQKVIKKNIERGRLPKAPIYSDVCSFDPKIIKQKVHIVYGGFPCQDISKAGIQKGAIKGERSNLWTYIITFAKTFDSKYIFMENVPQIINDGLQEILWVLTSSGYDAKWTHISAAQFGAPHLRTRWFLLATKRDQNLLSKSIKYKFTGKSENTKGGRNDTQMVNTGCELDFSRKNGDRTNYKMFGDSTKIFSPTNSKHWICEPRVDRVADGVPNRVHRCKALGNGVVPICVRYAFTLLFLKNE